MPLIATVISTTMTPMIAWPSAIWMPERRNGSVAGKITVRRICRSLALKATAVSTRSPSTPRTPFWVLMITGNTLLRKTIATRSWRSMPSMMMRSGMSAMRGVA